MLMFRERVSGWKVALPEKLLLKSGASSFEALTMTSVVPESSVTFHSNFTHACSGSLGSSRSSPLAGTALSSHPAVPKRRRGVSMRHGVSRGGRKTWGGGSAVLQGSPPPSLAPGLAGVSGTWKVASSVWLHHRPVPLVLGRSLQLIPPSPLTSSITSCFWVVRRSYCHVHPLRGYLFPIHACYLGPM